MALAQERGSSERVLAPGQLTRDPCPRAQAPDAVRGRPNLLFADDPRHTAARRRRALA